MALFRYQALSENGRTVQGTVDADHLQEAKLKLVRRKIAAIRIEPLSEKQIRSKLSKDEILNLTRETARLLQAGLPLFEALSALEEKYAGQRPHKILLDLCDQVRSGRSFSQGLASHPECFDVLYISMIANAEKTGSLFHALSELAELLHRQLKIRKQLVSALLYPSLLSGFCLVVIATLLFFVIPSLRELFDGRDLHPFTKIVFAASYFACNSKAGLLAVFAVISGCGAAAFFSASWRKRVSSGSYRIPFLKNFLAKIAFIRFCRAVATLLEGGLPLIQAFGQGRKVMRHPVLERVVLSAEEKISQGHSIHETFQNHPLVPALIPRMLAIAEEGGKLPFMMRQIAEIYEEELEKTLSQFTAVAQPVLLLILGGVIGFVLLSVLLPLTDVSSFATG